jgi:hypothetical protein
MHPDRAVEVGDFRNLLYSKDLTSMNQYIQNQARTGGDGGWRIDTPKSLCHNAPGT